MLFARHFLHIPRDGVAGQRAAHFFDERNALAYRNFKMCCAADAVEFDMVLGSRALQGSVPADRLREGASGLRATSAGLSVRFSDIAVDLDETSTHAVAHLTARIFFAGDNDFLVQEFRMRLEKSAEGWRVREVRTVRTMEQ